MQNIYNLLNYPSNVVQFQAFEEGMQVNGGTIMAVVDGMGGFKELALEFLAESGLTNIVPDDKHWYSQQKWLNVFQMIATRIGESTLFLIGKKIPKNAVFPPRISKNIEEALKSINIAYHINHKNKNGDILYDVNRDPPMLDGIGHYNYEKVEESNMIIMECPNPYPEDFDHGLITTMANLYFTHAEIKHDDSKPCRKRGDNSCTFVITW